MTPPPGAAAAAASWRIVSGEGPTVIRCVALTELPGIAHAFSTRRHGSGSDFDVGGPDETSGSAASARRELCRAAGLGDRSPLILRQVHGATVVSAGASAAGSRADGAVAVRGAGSIPLAVRTADCVPILMAYRRGTAVAAVHAGWRGAAAAIARRAVERLVGIGAAARDLRVALGPAIGPCCYGVGEDVLEQVARASGLPPSAVAGRGSTGARTLDLHGALRGQLLAAGVADDAIHTAPWCTACHRDLFFSYRRDLGRTGRHMACIGFVET